MNNVQRSRFTDSAWLRHLGLHLAELVPHTTRTKAKTTRLRKNTPAAQGKSFQHATPSLINVFVFAQENPLPAPKAPNKELIEHEKKRKIEAKLFSLAKQLREEAKLSEEEIKAKVGEERTKLMADL